MVFASNTLERSVRQLLFNTSLSPQIWLTGLTAVKDEWLSRAKLVFTYTRQHPYAPPEVSKNSESRPSYSPQDYAKLMRVVKCQSHDETMIKFWIGGLSKQYKNYVLTTCSSLRQSAATNHT